jgi:hypothetical protein
MGLHLNVSLSQRISIFPLERRAHSGVFLPIPEVELVVENVMS